MIISKTQEKNIDKLWNFYGRGKVQRNKIVEQLQDSLSYNFKNPYLLLTALTHSSAAKGCVIEGSPFYERLEFLGDSVLSLCISDILIKEEHKLSEGDLSKIRSCLVQEDYLVSIAERLNIKDYMLLGKSFGTECRKTRSILADIVEAILGAIYMDSSYSKVYKVVCLLYGTRSHGFSVMLSSLLKKDYKTVLQEYVQEKYKLTPVYELVSTDESEDGTLFEMSVSFDNKSFSGKARSKKLASQLAAKKALDFECS